jgi:hypothetical protein
VQRAGGDERVDARARRALQRLGRARDVAVVGACQRAHRALAHRVGNRPHRLEVSVGGGREAGFDHVDAQALELARDAQLLLACHRRAGGLFAIAQRGVEDDQLVGHANSCLRLCRLDRRCYA